MKFSTREDIEAPIDFVYGEVANFDAIERQVLRRGVRMERIEPGAKNGLGMAWSAQVPFRGKARDIEACITDITAPVGYRIESRSGGIVADFAVELVALSRGRTRVVAGLEIVPHTLSARLLVQSMKFAKANLQKRFAKRVQDYARVISERHTSV